jgi:PKD repeat protein
MKILSVSPARALAAAAIAIVVSGCSISEQTPPAVTGPSEFALSLTLSATPDTIAQDGTSQSEISVVARDTAGRPVSGVAVQFSGSSSNPLIRGLSFTETVVVTDANGRATTALIAPPAPATATTSFITVAATPIGSNFDNAVPRTVTVQLTSPAGTPLPNVNPEAVIIADPRVANFGETIRFDASLTSDEGQACGSRCQYIWEFGDNTVAVRGITATHAFALPGTYTVTLTVTDDRGGFDDATVSIRVIGPTAPEATFTVTPTSPAEDQAATFDASGSTIGAGGTIERYTWNFGDGTPTETRDEDQPTIQHTFDLPGSYTVTLTIEDNLGRRATRVATVTVRDVTP